MKKLIKWIKGLFKKESDQGGMKMFIPFENNDNLSINAGLHIFKDKDRVDQSNIQSVLYNIWHKK